MNDPSAMMKRFACLLLSTTLMLDVANAARAASQCGTRYSNRDDLERALRSQSARFIAGKGVRVAFVSSPTHLSLWWLTIAGSHAYPAIASVEKVQVCDGGFKRREAEANCYGAAYAACEGLRHDIAKAKF